MVKRSLTSLATAIAALGLLLSPATADGAAPQVAAAKPTQPSWFADSTIYEVNIRQYTKAGTFKEFSTHLPRLKALGVEVLWIMPIHPIGAEKRLGTLGSYYSVRDYKAVNPEFGSAADFKSLVTRAHQLGFKVVLDWVANHTAWDNAWVQDHPQWYAKDASGGIRSPAGWADVAQLDYNNTDLRKAMIDAMAFWVRNYGIDGFRADVASMVPADFWDEASVELQRIKLLLMIAEAQSNSGLMQRSFLVDYNWVLHKKMNHIGDGWNDVSGVCDIFAAQREEYDSNHLPMNFITNHDENSWNGTEYERLGRAVKAMTVLSFTAPGVPLIYTGQEMALNRRLKFFDRDPITWRKSTNGLLLTRLVGLKRNNTALWNIPGRAPVRCLPAGNDEVLAFSRVMGGNSVVVLINASDRRQKATVRLGAAGSRAYYSFATGKKITFDAVRSTVLPAYSYQVFTTQRWR